MEIIIRDALIPVDLSKELEEELYKLWLSGAPLNKAIRKGIKIFNDYWEKENADKSGG